MTDPQAVAAPRTPLSSEVRDALVAVGKAEQWDQVPSGTLRILKEAVEAAAAPAPQAEPLRAALVNGMAYALARADLPSNIETSRGYAERLAPLIVESGFLQASPPSDSRAIELLRELVDCIERLDHMGWQGNQPYEAAASFLKESGAVPASGEGRDE